MSKVLFVVPVLKPTFEEECLGTLLLATILKQNGIDVDIYRFYESDPDAGFDAFVENSVNNINDKEPCIVSFYCRGDCYLANIIIAKRLKEYNPNICIVFGGPQADVASKATIEQIPWVDYCCSGEGETTVVPLFSALLKGEDVTSVKGLTYRDKDKGVVSNPRPELICDLDTLPFIDYSFVPCEILDGIKENNSGLVLDVGRGCPFNCAYCSTSLFWQRRFRLKSSERIIAEMKELNEMLGTTVFGFEHDLFTANKKRIYEFCRVLKESNLNIKWTCSSRADTIDEELIKEMASAGLTAIFLGIETGSDRMQKLIHKKLNIEKTIEVVKCLVDNKVKVTASFMYGFPEETYEDIEATLQMAYTLKKLNISAFQFHLCSIFPGTEYFRVYKDKMVWAETVSDHTGNFGVKENLDFVRNHKEVFPFYYEYQSELRTRLNGLEKTALIFINLYDSLNKYDPEKISGRRMIDLYLDFKDANAELINNLESYKACKEQEEKLVSNYLDVIYEKEQADTLKEILAFLRELQIIKRKTGNVADIKMYNIDIDDVLKEKQLCEIKKIPSVVYINKTGKKISCRVQSLH